MPQTAAAEAKKPVIPVDSPVDLSTDHLMRPDEVEDAKGELGVYRRQVRGDGPVYERVQDRKASAREVKRIEKLLDQRDPENHRFKPDEIDLALKTDKALQDIIRRNMPTRDEMMKSPPGAVDRHTAWEKRNKASILAWKNLRRRLQASGVDLGYGDTGRDVANVETLRPARNISELPMEGALVTTGKTTHVPTDFVGGGNAVDEAARIVTLLEKAEDCEKAYANDAERLQSAYENLEKQGLDLTLLLDPGDQSQRPVLRTMLHDRSKKNGKSKE